MTAFEYPVPTPEAYKELIDSMPDLAAEGYGMNGYYRSNGLSNDDARKKFEDSRAELYRTYCQFEVCCKWLPRFKRIKSCDFGSYSLKQYIEVLEAGEAEYRPHIWNGVLIAAVKFLGIDSKMSAYDDMNIFVGLSRKSPVIKGVVAF